MAIRGELLIHSKQGINIARKTDHIEPPFLWRTIDQPKTWGLITTAAGHGYCGPLPNWTLNAGDQITFKVSITIT